MRRHSLVPRRVLMALLGVPVATAVSGGGAGVTIAAQALPPVLSAVDYQPAQRGARASDLSAADRAVPAVLGAVVGGAVGAFVGSRVGFELTGGGEICGDDPCGFVGGIYGFLIGEFVGIGLGAHLGDARRGQAGAAIGASFAALLLSGMLASVVEPNDAWIVLVPAGQIAAAVAAELASSR